MADVEIKFEREGAEGIVAVGTYLSDAAKRLGIRFDELCDPAEGTHSCVVRITEGADLLSPETSAEKKYFEEHGREPDERLACQTRFEKAGEVVVMTKKEDAKDVDPEEAKKEQSEEYRKQFAELPLDKKMSELLQLEAMALSETLSFVVNSPYEIANKLMGVMAGLGFKIEQQQKESAKPEEHRSNGTASENGTSTDPAAKGEEKGETANN